MYTTKPMRFLTCREGDKSNDPKQSEPQGFWLVWVGEKHSVVSLKFILSIHPHEKEEVDRQK